MDGGSVILGRTLPLFFISNYPKYKGMHTSANV